MTTSDANLITPPSLWRRWRSGALLILILIAAAALRFHDLTRHSFWTDEIYTLETSSGHGLQAKRLYNVGFVDPPPDLLSLANAGPWSSIATSLARDDNHPPLYFLLVRAWRHLCGDSDFAVRLLSLLFSVAAVALLYDATRLLHGPGPALWCALLMAVAQPQIQFAQEARSYALLLCLSAAACSATARIDQYGASTARCIALALCLLGMMLTHYYTVSAATALALFATLRFRQRDLRNAIITFAAAAFAFLSLWGWALWRQRLNLSANNAYIIEQSPGHLSAMLWRLMLIPAQMLCEPQRRAEAAAAFAGVLYVVPLFMLRRRPDLLIWVLWLLASVGLVALVDLIHTTRQLLFLRYTFLASPAIYALIAALAKSSRRRWLAHAVPASAVLACLLALPATYATTPVPKGDWRLHAAVIEREARPTDAIIFAGRYPDDPGIVPAYFYSLAHYTDCIPPSAAFVEAPSDPRLAARLADKQIVWVVLPSEVVLSTQTLPGFVMRRRHFVFGLPVLTKWERIGPTTSRR